MGIVQDGLERAARQAFTRPIAKSAGARMRYLEVIAGAWGWAEGRVNGLMGRTKNIGHGGFVGGNGGRC